MLKIEKFVTMSPEQWEMVIEGMRNPWDSWDHSDSYMTVIEDSDTKLTAPFAFFLGDNDHELMTSLSSGGSDHAKFRRMMPVWVTIVAPLYFWKEFDTYKVGTVANSCSTMHKLGSRDLTIDDCSTDHLFQSSINVINDTLKEINSWRRIYKEGSPTIPPKNKDVWYQMIQLLPDSYNQKRTVFLNYEVLSKMYRERKNHKQDEWHRFCAWIEELPYSELITGVKAVEDGERESGSTV